MWVINDNRDNHANAVFISSDTSMFDFKIGGLLSYPKLQASKKHFASKVGWARRDHGKERMCTIYIVSFRVIVGITFLAILSFIDTNRISI